MVVEEKKVLLPMLNLPTAWQTVIYRNYGFVKTEKIAEILGCDADIVVAEAKKLGLGNIKYNPEWEKSGYITIIRNNWYLLGYEQLRNLLGFSEEKLDYILKEEDFLFVKLGCVKPVCDIVSYSPLTAEEEEETGQAAKILSGVSDDEGVPFDFFADCDISTGKSLADAPGNRIVHGYLSPCGDVFMQDVKTYLDDALLEKYRRVGVNGIWIHGVLSSLSPYPFDPALSADYKTRRKNLKELIERCAKYSVKIFLYFNEPRCLALDKFGDKSYLIGHKNELRGCLCLSHKEVQDYLYNAFYDLLRELSGLGGIITITMSENMTHCQSLTECNCSVCASRPKWELAAEVNNIIMRALRDSGCGGELIANLWGWAEYMGFTEEDTFKGIAALDKDISVLSVSEFDSEVERGGVRSRLTEYSISCVGPSMVTVKNLAYARKLGHKIYAKIQVNNSWELSVAPVLPLYDLVYRHLTNLKNIGVGDYMASWTLGGYPSEALSLVAAFAEGRGLDEWYSDCYGEDAEIVHDAVKEFCRAFENYPVSMYVLYMSPKNLGYGNMWDIRPEHKESTMMFYSFDDYKKWTEPYPADVYLDLFVKLLEGWEKGLAKLRAAKGKSAARLLRYAEAEYLQMRSDVFQTEYSILKSDIAANANKIKEILKSCRNDVLKMIEIQQKDATIGYEASNHYFFNVRQLKERLLNIAAIEKVLP